MNTLSRVRTGPGKSLHLQNLASRPGRSLNSGAGPAKSWSGNSQCWAFCWMQGSPSAVPWAQANFLCCSILQCWSLSWMMRGLGVWHILYSFRDVQCPSLPQHRTLSIRHPLAFCRMWSPGCWVPADESLFSKLLGSPPGVWTQDHEHSRLGSYLWTSQLPDR